MKRVLGQLKCLHTLPLYYCGFLLKYDATAAIKAVVLLRRYVVHIHIHTWTCTSVYYAFCVKARRDLYQLFFFFWKGCLVIRIQAVRMNARQWKMDCGRFRKCLLEHISSLPSYLTSFCSLYQSCKANTDHAMLYLPTSRPTHICSELKPQW